MLGSATPASRIKLERFGKASVVLARCAGSEASPAAPDQSAYEPLFASASDILTDYRNLLDARRTVPGELARVATVTASTQKQVGKSPVAKSGKGKPRRSPEKQTPEKN
jgi:hypothetical protein